MHLSNIIALLDLPDISEFLANPVNTIFQILYITLGVFGYIFVVFSLMAIVYSHTKNVFAVSVFLILFGSAFAVLFPISFQILIYVIIGIIITSIIWKVFFLGRND